MQTKEAFKIITKVELKLKNEILNSNSEVWPILRNTAWHVLTTPTHNSSLKISNKKLRNYMSIFKNYLGRNLYHLISLFKNKYKKKDIKIIFFSKLHFRKRKI